MKKRLLGWLILFTMLFSFTGCSPFGETYIDPILSCLGVLPGGYTHPEFKTKYTVEEHIERITARTEEIFAEDIESGIVVDIFVDIVYAFYDADPEYFLVEVEYKEEIIFENYEEYAEGKFPYKRSSKVEGTNLIFMGVYPEKITHLIGYIQDDKYKTGLIYGDEFAIGASPYTLSGNRNGKKYYGANVLGIAQGEDILELNDDGTVKGIIDESRYKDLMKKNFKLFPRLY